MSASVLTGAVALVVFLGFFWLFVFGLSAPPKEHHVAPATLLPYIGVCFLCYTVVFIVAALAKLHAPITFGLTGVISCIGVPAWLIVRLNRRPLLGIEVSWLGIAACLSVFSYGYLPQILLKAAQGGHWTSDEVELKVISASVDLLAVWVTALCVFFSAKLFARSMAPPNNRWRGP